MDKERKPPISVRLYPPVQAAFERRVEALGDESVNYQFNLLIGTALGVDVGRIEEHRRIRRQEGADNAIR